MKKTESEGVLKKFALKNAENIENDDPKSAEKTTECNESVSKKEDNDSSCCKPRCGKKK